MSDVGFPNVRAAASSVERSALDSRVAVALGDATSSGSQVELERLRDLAGRSQAVFNRHLVSLQNWLLSDNPLFLSYFQQIEAGREPKDDRWERQRGTVENAVSPHYFDKLSVAALSALGRGMDYYGPYTVTLKEELIAHRATCFEENPFYFCKRDIYAPGEDVPPGYRSTWTKRSDLAVAKLAGRLAIGMSDEDLAHLMMEPRGSEADCDFLEVHIYGPIHRHVIKRVAGPVPRTASDRAIWKAVKKMLVAQGVDVEETK